MIKKITVLIGVGITKTLIINTKYIIEIIFISDYFYQLCMASGNKYYIDNKTYNDLVEVML